MLYNILSIFCTVSTLGLFVSGFPSCYKIIKFKDTFGAPFEIYLLILLTNISSLYYGLLIEDLMIVLINIIGLIIQTFYLVTFMVYTQEKKQSFILLTLVFGLIILPIYIYLNYYILDYDTKVLHMGYIGTIVGLISMLGPIKGLIYSLKNQTSSNISMPLTYGSILCGTSWALYGFYLTNIFIILPNLVGMFINLTYAYFGFTLPSTTKPLKPKIN